MLFYGHGLKSWTEMKMRILFACCITVPNKLTYFQKMLSRLMEWLKIRCLKPWCNIDWYLTWLAHSKRHRLMEILKPSVSRLLNAFPKWEAFFHFTTIELLRIKGYSESALICCALSLWKQEQKAGGTYMYSSTFKLHCVCFHIIHTFN